MLQFYHLPVSLLLTLSLIVVVDLLAFTEQLRICLHSIFSSQLHKHSWKYVALVLEGILTKFYSMICMTYHLEFSSFMNSELLYMEICLENVLFLFKISYCSHIFIGNVDVLLQGYHMETSILADKVSCIFNIFDDVLSPQLRSS